MMVDRVNEAIVGAGSGVVKGLQGVLIYLHLHR